MSIFYFPVVPARCTFRASSTAAAAAVDTEALAGGSLVLPGGDDVAGSIPSI